MILDLLLFTIAAEASILLARMYWALFGPTCKGQW